MNSFDPLDPNLSLLGHHSLEASAGTGKTFTIQHLAARLVLESFALDEILIVTFTRAATRELKTRIRSQLEALLISSAPPPYFTQEKTLAVEKALAEFDQAQIFTIHGFCQRMLTEYAFEAKGGVNLQSEEENHYDELLREAVTDFFRTSLTRSAYSDQQLAALMKYSGNDKDKLVQKILFFLKQDAAYPSYPDFNASYLDFLASLAHLPDLAFEDFLTLAPAFLGICDKKGVLKEQSQVKDLLHALATPSPEAFDCLLKESPFILSYFTEENRSKKKFTDEQLTPLYHLREKLLPIIEEAASPLHTLIRIARESHTKVQKTLFENECFSPDDLLKQMQQALAQSDFIKKVSSRYRAVIIDEFQDTDAIQWDIFKRLFVDHPAEAFYIVGDPKQSIYGFRNADLRTYYAAKKSMSKFSKLSTNYRSDPKLLGSLNALFSLQEIFPYDPVLPGPEAKDTLFHDRKNPLHFFIAEVEKEREKHWPSPAIEGRYFFPFVADEIKHLAENEGQSFRDMAILVKDRYQAARLKTFLEELRIPVITKSTEPLTASPLFSFFRFLFRALLNPHDIQTLLAHPIFGFTHQELEQSEELVSESVSFIFHLKNLFQNQGFHALIDALLQFPWKPSCTFLELLVQSKNLEAYSDFMRLAEILIEEALASKGSLEHLQSFLESLSTLSGDKPKYARRLLSDLNSVTIMTIHMSKGLEFPIVFALGLVNRYTGKQDFIRHESKWLLFDPSHPSCQPAIEELQFEKFRALYVALTRAKKRLYVPLLIDPKGIPAPQESLSPLELFFSNLPQNGGLARISHTISNEGRQDGASDLFSRGRNHCQIDKESPLEGEDDATDCADSSRGCEKCGLEEFFSSVQATSTYLEPAHPTPYTVEAVNLYPPVVPDFHFPSVQIHSFSSLSKHTSSPPLETPPDALPKGAQTGILLHSLLEGIIKQKLTSPYNQKAVHEYISNVLSHAPLKPWEAEIMALVDKTFHLPLNGFTLADIPSHHLYPETEFLFSLNKKTLLKGFADLIFFHGGHYYLLDWKSNLLSDYTEASLEIAMEQNDYFLQAEIYAEALSHYLAFKQDPHPISGAYYLFLRGALEGQGVYFLPDSSLRARKGIRGS